jgi:penicillin-binding protein 1A
MALNKPRSAISKICAPYHAGRSTIAGCEVAIASRTDAEFYGAEQRAKIVLASMVELRFINPSPSGALAHPPRIVPQVNMAVNYAADWAACANTMDTWTRTSYADHVDAPYRQARTLECLQRRQKRRCTGAVDPDGALRAGRRRNYAESQFNRAVAAKRQPGSAFKPFVYLTAIERGLTPETVREDKPIAVKRWRPENYSHEYFGP